MQQIIDFVNQNWGWMSLVGLFLISLLNSITAHFGEKNPKIVPFFSVIIEALSFITSKGVVNGSWGKLKLPLQNISPKTDAKK